MNHLREFRRKARLTQQGLAKRSGVFASEISKIESGVNAIPLTRHAARIAAALGYKISTIFPDGTREPDYSKTGRREVPVELKPEPMAPLHLSCYQCGMENEIGAYGDHRLWCRKCGAGLFYLIDAPPPPPIKPFRMKEHEASHAGRCL